MNLKNLIAIQIDRPTTLPSQDWGIGRNPATVSEPCSKSMGSPFPCCNKTPPLHEPDYKRLRRTNPHVTDPVSSYADYIRSK